MIKLILSLLFSLCVFVNNVFSSSSISCENSTYCHQQLGTGGYCDDEFYVCECATYFFKNDSKCQSCPGVDESCELSGCCAEYLSCQDNECVYCLDQYCWGMDDAERERLQRVAQVILAVALLLTASILFVLFWNACTRHRRALANQESPGRRQGFRVPSGSFHSLTSIQRLVLMQLQDRPPPYNSDQMTPWKNLCDITEPPPSYDDALGLSAYGEVNPVFFIEENTQVPAAASNTLTQTNIIQTNTTQNQVNLLPTAPALPSTTASEQPPAYRTSQTNCEATVPIEDSQNSLRYKNNVKVQDTSSSELHI